MTRALAPILIATLFGSPLTAQTAPDLPLTARGNEPFWTVTITPEALRLIEPEGKGSAQDFPYSAETTAEGTLYSTNALTLRITPALCHDDMTGIPHPFRATLTRNGTESTGCAGDPETLLAGDWAGTAVNGTALAEGITVSLSFADGQVSGQSGCNRFTGGYALTGEGLTLTPIAATRMACPAPQMETETALFDALRRTARFDIGADGSLLLFAGDATPVLTASPQRGN